MSVWMLLVAYCFSVGAAAYAVLSCHCLERERGEVHICCRGCDIHTECDSHSVSFKAVCCGVDHSKASELYTSVSSSQWERDTKVMIVDLPAILAAEMTALPFDSVHWATVSERPCLAHSTGPSSLFRTACPSRFRVTTHEKVQCRRALCFPCDRPVARFATGLQEWNIIFASCLHNQRKIK